MAFDYASRDFDTIKRDLLARADRIFPEWTDRDPSDFGMLLLDLWAYEADVLHYYIDRAAGEAFLPTATQRESVLALANLLDYVPRGRTSAEATVTLSNTGATAHAVAPNTQFIARYDNSTFQCYALVGGNVPGTGSTAITVREGTIIEDEVLTSGSSGQGAQRYSLGRTNAVARSLDVSVFEDGVTPTTYQQVARISSAATGDRVFTVAVSASGDVEVVFGTSLNGFVPPPGSRITATYAASSGEEGNLPANAVFGFKSATPANITIDSSSAFSGGVNEESIASLKRSIPNVISAQNRAVTRNDFVALATQVEGVAKATISFTPGAGAANGSVVVYPQPRRGDFLTTTDTSQAVSADIQADVVASLQPRALLGVDVSCAATITWTPVHVTVTVNVSDRFVSNWVRRDVEAAIDELFDFDNVFFGQRLTLGQVYRVILNVPGVDYATITRFDTGVGTAVQPSILIDSLMLPRKGTVTPTMVGGITTS